MPETKAVTKAQKKTAAAKRGPVEKSVVVEKAAVRIPRAFGGREKGALNRDKKELIDRIQQNLVSRYGQRLADWDPVIELASIGANPKEEVQLRLNACKEVAKYIHSQKRAIEGDIRATHEAGETLLAMLSAATKPGVSAILSK